MKHYFHSFFLSFLLLLACISNAYAITEGNWFEIKNSPYVYFDNSLTQWENVALMLGRQWDEYGKREIGSYGQSMPLIPNTKLHWVKSNNETGNNSMTTLAFFNTTDLSWKKDNTITTRSQDTKGKYTDSYNTGMDGGFHLFVPASGEANAALTYSKSTSAADLLHRTQTVVIMVSTDEGATYRAVNTFSGSISAKVYTMSDVATATQTTQDLYAQTTLSAIDGVLTSDITFTANAVGNYTFKGWGDSEEAPTGTSSKTYTYPIAGAKTVYAFYTTTPYTISYELNGGTNPENAPTSYIESDEITLPTPTRSGYVFRGWYSDNTYTTQVTTIPTGSTGDTTLYALWEQEGWYLNYEEVDGSYKKQMFTGDPLTATIAGVADHTYPMEVVHITQSDNGGIYYKNNSTMECGNHTGWVFTQEDTKGAFLSTIAGDYVFTMTFNAAGNPVVSLAYPVQFTLNYDPASCAIGKTVEFAVTPACDAVSNYTYEFQMLDAGGTSYKTFATNTTGTAAYMFPGGGNFLLKVRITDNSTNTLVYTLDKNIPVAVTTYYLRHPFGGNADLWSAVPMTPNGDGTYIYYGEQSYIYWNYGANVGTTGTDKDDFFHQVGSEKTPSIYDENGQKPATITAENDHKQVVWIYDAFRNTLKVNDPDQAVYRLAIHVDANTTYYSNRVFDPSQPTTVSFFAKPGATIAIERYGKSSMQWTQVATLANPVTTPGVYTATLTIDETTPAGTLTAVAAYTGDFYIYSDNTSFDTATVEKPSGERKYNGTMVDFDKYNGAKYNHYWVKWLASGEGTGASDSPVKSYTVNTFATVGNKINTNLATILPDYYLPAYQYLTNEGASVRYAYDSETNYFARAHLAGSTNKEQNRFLTIFGTNLQTVAQTTEDGVIPSTDITSPENGLVFSDVSNWIYSARVQVNQTETSPKAASLKLAASFNGAYTYLLSADGTDNGTAKIDMIPESNTLGDTPQFVIIYDYKTNRVISGWQPKSNQEINTSIMVDNMVVTRTDDGASSEFSIPSGEIVVTNRMTTEFVITKAMFDAWHGNTTTDGDKTYKTMLFWISLPYDCKINTIYGFEGDYSKASGSSFEIQVYRGDLRGAGKAGNDNVWQALSPFSTMRANRGYVLSVRLSEKDFQEILGTSEMRFFFPSSGPVTLIPNPATDLVANNGGGASVADIQKGWNVMGVPVMHSACGFKLAENDDFGFVYRWTWADGARWYEPFPLVDQTGTENKYFNFKPGHAYMVQVGGDRTLTWNYTQQSGTAWNAPMRVAANRLTDRTFRIDLVQDEDMLDKTYILYRTGATRGYEIGRDLEKIENPGRSMLYAEVGSKLAAVCLADTDRLQIPLTVVAAESGEYVLQLPAPVSDAEVVLYDQSEDIATLLNQGGYSVYLPAGTYRNRFYLGITPKAETPTGIGDAENGTPQAAKYMDAQGNLYILRNGKWYDALGHSVTIR